MGIRKGERGLVVVYIIQLGPETIFLCCGVTGTNEMQIESRRGKKMMCYTVIGTP